MIVLFHKMNKSLSSVKFHKNIYKIMPQIMYNEIAIYNIPIPSTRTLNRFIELESCNHDLIKILEFTNRGALRIMIT